LYARKMGLKFSHDNKSPYNIDISGRSIVDIGGGPCSLLLKVTRAGHCCVVDPLSMPDWVHSRYNLAGIVLMNYGAEAITRLPQDIYDEAWIYNCLQHTMAPKSVVDIAQKHARVIRVFEWLDTSTNVGHPHSLTKDRLDKWFGGEGKTEELNGEANCWGKCYYGIFPGG